MPSTSELAPIASQHGTPTDAQEPVRVGIQPVQLIKRNAKIAGIAAFAVAACGFLAVHARMKPLYEASAIVYVSPLFPTALADDHDHDRQYESFLEQQITAATRYETLLKAVRAYPDAWPRLFPTETEQSQVTRLQKALKVEEIGHSYEVSISLESEEQAHVADFVNQITANYLDDARNEEVYGRDQKLATLTQEKADLQKQLDTAFQEQNQLLHDVGMAHFDGGSGANPYDDGLVKLREQLGEAREKNEEADAELRSMGSGNLASPALQQAAAEEVKTDLAIQAANSGLQTKKAANMAQMTGLRPGNPLLVQLTADNLEIDQRLEQLNRDAIKKAAARIQQRLLSAKSRAASLEGELNADVARTTTQATTAAPRLQQAQVLSGKVDRIQALMGVVEKRIQDVSLEGDSPGSIHLFSSALPPGAPVKRKTAIAYGAVVLASLLTGFAAAYLADKLDPHIYTSTDVRRLVGFPPMGLLLSREFAPDLQKEYFLRLAGGLDQAHRRTGARTFVFPSVGRRSSSEIVERLGAELASNGLRVLVVNVQSGAKHDRSERPSPFVETSALSPRLLTVTDGSSQLSSEVDKEPYRVISLPATEVAELLRRSRSYYNTILVAADPLFTSAYTEHFARTADGTVLIVDSGETKKEELVRAARLLERLKIAGIAIVLNGITERRAEEDVARQIADYKRNAA